MMLEVSGWYISWFGVDGQGLTLNLPGRAQNRPGVSLWQWMVNDRVGCFFWLVRRSCLEKPKKTVRIFPEVHACFARSSVVSFNQVFLEGTSKPKRFRCTSRSKGSFLGPLTIPCFLVASHPGFMKRNHLQQEKRSNPTTPTMREKRKRLFGSKSLR